MRVTIDETKCAGYAACVEHATAVFALNEDGLGEVTVERVPTAQVANVDEAILDCPTGAISCIDE